MTFPRKRLQLKFFLAGKRPLDKPVRVVPLAQGGNLAPPGLKVTVTADTRHMVPQDGLGGFHGKFTFIAPAQLPDAPLPGPAHSDEEAMFPALTCSATYPSKSSPVT